MGYLEGQPISITLYGAQALISGEYPARLVDQVTSYPVVGAEFSKPYQNGIWDGRKRLGNKRTGAFPIGLVSAVKGALEEAGHEVVVADRRHQPGRLEVWGRPSYELAGGYVLRPYQLDCVKAGVEREMGIINACTGSGKSLMIAGLVHALRVRSLILVPTRELLHQLHQTLLAAIPDATDKSIGIVGDNEWAPGILCTIATVSILSARLETAECQALLADTECLIADEVHTMGSDTYYEVAQSCHAYYRFGLSGTAFDRTDEGTLRLIAAFGERIATVEYRELVEAKVLPRATIIFDQVTKPAFPKQKKPEKKLTYPQVYERGVVHNPNVLSKTLAWTKHAVSEGLSVLILVDQIQHGQLIDKALWEMEGDLISHMFIHGESDNRDEAIRAFRAREIPVLIGSSILDTGISIDSVDMLVCAGSRKSKIKVLQRLGRALRGEKAIVVEFFNSTHRYLREHSAERFRSYRAENCFSLKQSPPSRDLIRRVWGKDGTGHVL